MGRSAPDPFQTEGMVDHLFLISAAILGTAGLGVISVYQLGPYVRSKGTDPPLRA